MNNSFRVHHGRDRQAASLPVLGLAFFLLALLPVGLWLASAINLDKAVIPIVVSYSLIMIVLGLVVFSTLYKTRRLALLTIIAGQIFWFAIPALGVVSDGDWFGEKIPFYISEHAVVVTTGYLFAFTALLLAAYWFFSLFFKSTHAEKAGGAAAFAGISDKQLLCLVIVLSLLGMLPFIVFGGDLKTIVTGILSSRSVTKAWSHRSFKESNPLYVVGRASFATAGALSLFFVLKTPQLKERLIWGAIFVFAFVITYFDSGTRSWTLLMIGPPILFLLWRAIENQKLKRWVVAGPLLLVCVLWVAQLQHKFRTTGITSDTLTSGGDVKIKDNDFFTETAVAVSLVPDRMDYVEESTLVLFLTNPIPRGLWANKPYPLVIRMYTIGRSGGRDEYGEKGISRLPSVVGQHYLSGGVAGIGMVAIFYGLVAALCDSLLRRKRVFGMPQLWAATVAVWLFIGYRGLFPGFHYPILIIGLLVLYEWYKGRRKARTASRYVRFGRGVPAQLSLPPGQYGA